MAVVEVIDELTQIVFEGFFQRNQKAVAAKREHRNKLKKKDPALVAKFDEIHYTSDTKESPEDRKHDFTVKVIEYNPDSGLFIAKGTDYYGESGLVGDILDDKIRFFKFYAGKPTALRENTNRFDNILYEGHIYKPDEIITCGGIYHPPRGWNDSYGGTWRLDSQPRK